MKKVRITTLLLAFIASISFAFAGIDASAVTKASSKTATAKKATVKKATGKASVKTSSKKSAVKKNTKTKKRITSKRRKGYSRGSGSTLGDGNIYKLVTYAKRYLGVHYNFGRSSSKGFDCSGFTMFVFRNAGITLPHSATAQSNLGLAVDKSNLKAGDLVFFETVRAGISHVGMYIGNNHFIHASSGVGRVTISSLSDCYYAPRFRGATRIIND